LRKRNSPNNYTANTRHKPWRVLRWVGFPAPDEAAQNKKTEGTTMQDKRIGNWSNFETWLINLTVMNTALLYRFFKERRIERHGSPWTADNVREFVISVLPVDMIQNNINWKELADFWNDK